MLDTLVNIVKEQWSDSAIASEPFPITDDDLIVLIKRARLIDYQDVVNYMHERDSHTSDVTVARSNGLVTFILTDLDGAGRQFGYRRRYHIWPDPPSIFLNDVALDPSVTYTWNPHSFTLDLDSSVLSTDEISIQGHLLAMHLLLADVGNLLASKYEQIADVKGPEFQELARRTRKRVNKLNARILEKPKLV